MKRERKTDRRADLVRAAYDLIATKGLEGLRTRDIADEVGINISTLHYHFATKEALIAAVVEHATHQFRTLHPPLPPRATPVDELRHLFASHAYRRRMDSKVDVVVQEILLRARRDELVREAFESLLIGWRAAVEGIVARGVRDGRFRADVDPKVAAAVITSFLIGSNQLGIVPLGFSLDDAAEAFVSWLRPNATKSKRRSR